MDKELIAEMLSLIEGVELSDEEHFYLHFNTPYMLTGRRIRMNAFLRGVGDGSQAMKQAIVKAIKGEATADG